MVNLRGKKIQMTEMSSVGDDRDRSMRLKIVIEEMLKDINMSGEEWNDYDKNGVPYWEKYAERLKYMEENGI
jgi:hypothetical protein